MTITEYIELLTGVREQHGDLHMAVGAYNGGEDVLLDVQEPEVRIDEGGHRYVEVVGKGLF